MSDLTSRVNIEDNVGVVVSATTTPSDDLRHMQSDDENGDNDNCTTQPAVLRVVTPIAKASPVVARSSSETTSSNRPGISAMSAVAIATTATATAAAAAPLPTPSQTAILQAAHQDVDSLAVQRGNDDDDDGMDDTISTRRHHGLQQQRNANYSTAELDTAANQDVEQGRERPPRATPPSQLARRPRRANGVEEMERAFHAEAAASTDTTPSPPPPPSHRESTNATTQPRPSCLAWCWTRLVCVPLILTVTITTVIGIVVVILVPGFLFLTVSIGCYYCCTRDAIPLRVLLQAMLGEANAEAETAAAATLTTNEIHAALIRRTCLAIVPRPDAAKASSSGSSTAVVAVERDVQAAADYISVHDHFTYYFSAPLAPPAADADAPSHSAASGSNNLNNENGTASLEVLLDSMNARYTTVFVDTDDDDDTAMSDRAVIQRHTRRARRLGHGARSTGTLEAPGSGSVEMVNSTVPSSLAMETSSQSPATARATLYEDDESAHAANVGVTDPNDIELGHVPSNETNAITTIMESANEASIAPFDEVWDTVSLASTHPNGSTAANGTADSTSIMTVVVEQDATSSVPPIQRESQGENADEESAELPLIKDDSGSLSDTQNTTLVPDAKGDEDNDSCDTGGRQSGIACDICLIPYKVSDVLAWSHNPLCNHAYHVECITDWIQASTSTTRNHHSCPNCRNDFLFYEHYQKKQRQNAPIALSMSPTRPENEAYT
jgi:Ring finger domain